VKRVINRDMLYGLPHIMCSYRGKSVNSHRLDEDAVCVCCGRPATNAHHWPPKGTAPVRHRAGFELKPALFAVCGSGTTGCHDGFHGGARYDAWWEWDEDGAEDRWEDGSLLQILPPHSPGLYQLGHWVILDKRTGFEIKYHG
jgi:hypothetical protein